jgi:ABC-type multidrug transport system ATPase subunit
VLGLQAAFSAISDRQNVVFVNNNFTGGEIERIITSVGNMVRASGKDVMVVEKEDDLLTVCKSSLQGVSDCVAAVVFYSTPTEPEGAGLSYNYTLRFDGSLGAGIDVRTDNNAAQLFVMPLQHAIDSAIVNVNSTGGGNLLPEVDEFPFTSLTQEERATRIRTRYNSALINILAVALFIGICGIQYQQVGTQATERETRMAQLVEVMMPNRRRWEPQFARLASYHIAFDLIYLPGWIIMAIILHFGVFLQTSAGIVIITHLLTGLSLASFSLFAASFFKRAQLSGITTILVSLVLAIIAQVYHDASNGAVIFCSLVFPSMTYTYLIVLMARFETQNTATNLVQSAPDSPWGLVGIAFWIFFLIQILVYPVLGAIVERLLWGTTSSDRHLTSGEGVALELKSFSKSFEPNWVQRKFLPIFGKKRKESVLAVDDLSLKVLPGQISLLLGANGSGKSTTLDAIAGLSKPSHGSISLDFQNGLGFCPQQNVLWRDLTVYEHVAIFNKIKSMDATASKEDNQKLIEECDLKRKALTKAHALSGGQMRKLQLACMFTGGSKICLVDECSSGIDPIARKKIQNIMLAERDRTERTIIFTSHYLDEADIADYILIMSKGRLKLQGTSPEIKQSGKYRIHMHHTPESKSVPILDGISRQEMFDQTIYSVSEASQAAAIISKFESNGYNDYTVSGPTVEDAFMKVAEEMVPAIEKTFDADKADSSSSNPGLSDEETERELNLSNSRQIGPIRQGMVLLRKRSRVFLRNIYPNLAAMLLIPIAAGLAALFLKGFQRAGCSPTDQVSASAVSSLSTRLQEQLDLVAGPSSMLNQSRLELILSTFQNGSNSNNGARNASPSANLTGLIKSIHLVDTFDDFTSYIEQNYHNVTPGGFFLGGNGTPPTIAWQGDNIIAYPMFVQNALDTVLTGIPISTQYSTFDIPWSADQGKTLQFVVYFGLVISIAPAFFALYPTLERLRHVRGLHYSNGVRALPLWLAYVTFDFSFVILGSSLAIIILAATFSPVFLSLATLWVVMILFGLCATLFSYVVSLYARSQLGAFAIAAAYQAVTALLYVIAYLSTSTYGKIGSTP